jgi:hypothetical protein
VCLECCWPPEWHPVGPLPTLTLRAKVGSSPNFSANFCVTTSAAAIGQLDVGIKQSLEEKWRNARRGGVPLAHSRRSLTQAKFLPRDCAGHIVVGHNPFIFLASAWTCLRSTQPRQSTGWRLRYPSTQANFTKIDQAPATWGKARSCGYASATTRAGRPTRDALSAQIQFDGLLWRSRYASSDWV